jgi:hypothetical protein
MPRQIDVTLQTITCNRNGFGGAVQVSGDVFGETFQNAPNDPAQSTGKQDIFPFPSGPISLTAGQIHKVKMEIVRFFLHAQDQESPELFPHFLTIGGTLSPGLGSQFFTIAFNQQLPFIPEAGNSPPEKFDLVFESSNVKITLTFGAGVSLVF